MPGCRNILIAPYGNSATVLTDYWLKYKGDKEFDVCLLFYHQEVINPQKYDVAEYFFHLKGFKFRMIHEVLINLHPEWMDNYDYFYFIDDDVQIDTHQINQMFDLAKAHDVWIAQASLTKDSFCSWPILKTNNSCFCRYMGQIEVMAPLFSKYALEKCLEAGTFITNNSSWGIDCAWPHILEYPRTRLVVFDIITMKHIHPVGKGELYKRIGDPHGDWDAVVKKYGTKKHNYQEYGRLLKVNSHVNILQFGRYKFVERLKQVKKDYNDYPLSARVKSKLNKIKAMLQKPPIA